eukprot:CAMPEP_0177789024 /NCGR_PEP_ID=MMETSP0491_2-20121128/22486_1 /TAXON_ID=63592 /ORGANISM="Tetraselmis chuii, Strain PLY429" /LENGTH=335 /DNA_ID=CAMNT_0019310775 /DNA_START=59 /DNA_END=1067 /DNA_ORIENTATION=-
MVAGSEGSLTRRGSQGALALLALRREAGNASVLPFDDHHYSSCAVGEQGRSPLPFLRAMKARTKKARQLQQQLELLERAKASVAVFVSPELPTIISTTTTAGRDVKQESGAEGRQHAGTAFAALSLDRSDGPATCQLNPRDGFSPLSAFAAYLASRREKSQEGKARFAGLSTAIEYAALVRVRKEQDVHCIRKKGKKPASERASTAEQPGDPQRRYYLRSGNWELADCELTGESVLCRWIPEKNGQGFHKQVWVHEGNVEQYLWHIHHRQLNHAGMDKTWAEVQKQLYGCTQSLCRVYVVSCQCVQTKVRHKRKAPVDQNQRACCAKHLSSDSLE